MIITFLAIVLAVIILFALFAPGRPKAQATKEEIDRVKNSKYLCAAVAANCNASLTAFVPDWKYNLHL